MYSLIYKYFNDYKNFKLILIVGYTVYHIIYNIFLTLIKQLHFWKFQLIITKYDYGSVIIINN